MDFKYTIVYAGIAELDLELALSSIRNSDKTERNKQKFVDELLGEIARLSESALGHPIYEAVTRFGQLRSIHPSGYTVPYHVNESSDVVTIMRVLRSTSDIVGALENMQ